MSNDRILTTHVGSLVRPAPLSALIAERENADTYDEEAFQDCLEDAIAVVVDRQRDVGLDIINDGEFGKLHSWTRYINERLDGFVDGAAESATENAMSATVVGKDMREFHEFYAAYNKAEVKMKFRQRPSWVNGPIRYKGHAAVQEDIRLLKRALVGVEAYDAFMPAVAPASVIAASFHDAYRTEEEYLFALAEALREEYRAIIEAGFIVQIDDAFMATTYDVMVPSGPIETYRRWAHMRVDALNHALSGLPEDRTRYHLCWGSWNGPHTNDVPFREIADLVLQIKVGGYALELANPRHEHEWRVWEDLQLPEGRKLIPGVISHSTNVVEHPELVAERILRLAKLVGRENVIASTDCGFAQGALVRRVHESVMWAKLTSLVEGARIASNKLWAGTRPR